MHHDVMPSMREIDMMVAVDDEPVIAGTLALPAGDGPHPAMVLLWPPRSDREGDVGRTPLGLGRPLAAALAAKGVASYRFDRRGTGATPGKRLETTFLQHRRDAAAILDALAARPDVSAVGAIGYSEGALHATWLGAHAGAAAVVLLAAVPDRRGGLHAVVGASGARRDSVAGPARPEAASPYTTAARDGPPVPAHGDLWRRRPRLRRQGERPHVA
jgi:hypothetical protein